MKVLITGVKGQLGSRLAEILADGASSLGQLPLKLSPKQILGVDLPELDITNLTHVRRYVEAGQPEVIVNCAAYTHVDGCEIDTDAAFAVNTLGARNMAMAAQSVGAKIIHISTDYVFEGNGTKPYVEWDICNPQSAYGHTKHLGEQYVRDFCSRYFIVRTAWLYGLTGGNFVKAILKKADETGALTVVGDQFGNPTYAEDLSHHIVKLLATEEYGVYHCTNNGICSWYDFASEIIRLSGIKCSITSCSSEDYPSPTKRPAYSALDNRMLRCTIGDEMRDWKDAVKDFMDQYWKRERN